jgi:acetyl esterase/lipase
VANTVQAVKVAAMAGLVQFLSYVNLVVNYRAVAHEQYVAAMLTDALAVWFAYTIIKRVQHSDSRLTLVGMIVGGSLAAWVGIYLTRTWG